MIASTNNCNSFLFLHSNFLFSIIPLFLKLQFQKIQFPFLVFSWNNSFKIFLNYMGEQGCKCCSLFPTVQNENIRQILNMKHECAIMIIERWEHSRRGLCKSRCYLTIYLDAGHRSKLDYDAFNMRMISRLCCSQNALDNLLISFYKVYFSHLCYIVYQGRKFVSILKKKISFFLRRCAFFKSY